MPWESFLRPGSSATNSYPLPARAARREPAPKQHDNSGYSGERSAPKFWHGPAGKQHHTELIFVETDLAPPTSVLSKLKHQETAAKKTVTARHERGQWGDSEDSGEHHGHGGSGGQHHKQPSKANVFDGSFSFKLPKTLKPALTNLKPLVSMYKHATAIKRDVSARDHQRPEHSKNGFTTIQKQTHDKSYKDQPESKTKLGSFIAGLEHMKREATPAVHYGSGHHQSSGQHHAGGHLGMS